jgi:hypothetical protein
LLDIDVNGRINKISRAKKSASTPPNLLGMDRKIAYSHRKYHSGLICVGVTKGFAKRKFSGSVNIFGLYIIISINKVKVNEYPKKSLIEKYE